MRAGAVSPVASRIMPAQPCERKGRRMGAPLKHSIVQNMQTHVQRQAPTTKGPPAPPPDDWGAPVLLWHHASIEVSPQLQTVLAGPQPGNGPRGTPSASRQGNRHKAPVRRAARRSHATTARDRIPKTPWPLLVMPRLKTASTRPQEIIMLIEQEHCALSRRPQPGTAIPSRRGAWACRRRNSSAKLSNGCNNVMWHAAYLFG